MPMKTLIIIFAGILNYLKQLKVKTKSAVELSKNLSQIILEDRNLLEKLA